MIPRLIYLDHNATTPLLPEAAAAMDAAQEAAFANPASQHAAGRKARQILEDSREAVTALLGAQPTDRLLFTSGGTEANNLALLGAGEGRLPIADCRLEEEENASDSQRPLSFGNRQSAIDNFTPPELILSSIEHPSVAGPAEELKRQGWNVVSLPVDRLGVIQVDRLDDLLTPRTRLVSVMLANNETGVRQPVAEVAARCRAAEAQFGTTIRVHTDAVQAVGKSVVDFRALGVDALSFTAHKFHGPRGVGGLLLRQGVGLSPLLFGGFQQDALRPGTESPALAAGMHAALSAWQREADRRAARMTELRDRFERGVLAMFPSAVVHGSGAPRMPHTSNIGFPGRNRQALLMALDLAGICCSTGSACASGSSDPSPVLLAMGCPMDIVEGSLRFSLGATTTTEEIDEALLRLGRVLGG